MRIYHAGFPFEVNTEEGRTGFYSPSLKPLRREIRRLVNKKVESEPDELKFFTQPIGEPVAGRVTIEITVDIESIETAPITKALFCQVVNGGGGFVQSRSLVETMRFRFLVDAECFTQE